jgi:replicative DNA helicase
MTDEWKDPVEAITYTGPDRVVHFSDYLLQKAGDIGGNKRFYSGFSQFDSKMGGLETGEVIIISGHRKEGKTLFAESWINGMVDKNPEAKAMILSYEVQADKLLAKYMSDMGRPVYLPLALETMDFEWLKKKCVEAKFKYNCKIVLIDHLHFMVDMNTKQNMSLNIGAFMRRLKQDIALKLNMAAILIAHQGQPREGKDASIDSIRDSSFVAQESDATIIVSRRKNLDAVELHDVGEELAQKLKAPEDAPTEDRFSAQLALIKIECHRRTGVFQWKKLYQKRGEFFEEV